MTRPHETLGLRQPLGRHLPDGLVAWNVFFFILLFVFGGAYVLQVNVAASKGYALRTAEKRIHALQTENMMLQDTIVTKSSMQELRAHATELGLVPTDRLEFVNPAASSYALAK
jgi:hypothetical protein